MGWGEALKWIFYTILQKVLNFSGIVKGINSQQKRLHIIELPKVSRIILFDFKSIGIAQIETWLCSRWRYFIVRVIIDSLKDRFLIWQAKNIHQVVFTAIQSKQATSFFIKHSV